MLVKFLRNYIAPRRRRAMPAEPLPDRTDAARRLFESGRVALARGDAQSARALLQEALAQSPTHGDAWFHLSAAHHALRNLLDAGICCARALEIDAQPQNWRDSQKNITTDIGHPDDLKRWEALADSHWIAQLALGNTLRRLERTDEAEAAYRKALQRSGDSPFAARRLACLLAITGRFDQADAHFLASAGVGLTPDNVLRMSQQFFSELTQSAAATRSRLPCLQGLPTPTMRELVFVLSCDPGYFRKFAYAAANAIRQNCRAEFLIHFHIVDPDDGIADEIAQLRDSLGFKELNYSCESAPSGDLWSKRTWYACARFLRLPDLLRAYRKPLWLLDLDQLVVADIDRCMTAAPGVKPADIALVQWHPTRWEPWEQFSASAVYAAPTAGALEFLDRTATYVGHYLALGRPVWFLDQIALFAACAQAGSDCMIRFLPPATIHLADPGMPLEPPPGSVFWSVTNSLEQNAASLTHPVFLRYSNAGAQMAPPVSSL